MGHLGKHRVAEQSCDQKRTSGEERLLQRPPLVVAMTAEFQSQRSLPPHSGHFRQRRPRPLRVETTRRRAAACGHRVFNAGFAAMNPNCWPSQPDPLLSSAALTQAAVMQREEPVASARFLTVQCREAGSRSAAVRVGRRSTHSGQSDQGNSGRSPNGRANHWRGRSSKPRS